MGCPEHPKRENCNVCGQCRKCKAPEHCKGGNHILADGRGRGVRKRKNKGHHQVQSSRPSRTTSSRVAASKAAAVNERIAHELNEQQREEQQDLLPTLSEVTELFKVEGAPVSPADATTLAEASGRTSRKWRAVIREILLKLCDIMCPDDPAAIVPLLERVATDMNTTYAADACAKTAVTTTVHETLKDIIVHGSSTNRRVCLAVLCSSESYVRVCELLNTPANREVRAAQIVEAKKRRIEVAKADTAVPEACAKQTTVLGRHQFAASRKDLALLVSGKDFPVQQRRSRISTTQLASAVNWIQENLEYRPGKLRNVRLGDTIFRNVPIYLRNDTVRQIHKSYRNSMNENSAIPIGQNNFERVLRVLTKAGKQQAALSPHYVDFLNVTNIAEDAADRIYELAENSEAGRAQVREFRQSLSAARQFLVYEMKGWMKINSVDGHKCAHFAVGGVCDHGEAHFEDPDSKLWKALNCDKTLVNAANTLIATDETGNTHGTELSSILGFAAHFHRELLHYASHVARDFWQEAQIFQLLDQLHSNPRDGILVIDHKMKTDPQAPKESQSEFFEKKGMSILGAMFVRSTIDKHGIQAYKYHFIDMVVENTTNQDVASTIACVNCLLQYISGRFPDIERLTIQSDNASCFSSHAFIPFVHMLNFKNRGTSVPLVQRWVYTEVGCGKSRLDTHFSFIVLQLSGALAAGVAYRHTIELFEALTCNGGMKGTDVLLVSLNMQDAKEFVKLLTAKSQKIATGISTVHDVEYPNMSDEHAQTKVVIRQHTGIGDGEEFNCDVFDVPILYEISKEHRAEDSTSLTVQSGKRDNEQAISSAKKHTPVRHSHMLLAEALSSSQRGAARANFPKTGRSARMVTHGVASSGQLLGLHWAKKVSRQVTRIAEDVALRLQEMYKEGDGGINKGKRWTAERADWFLKTHVLNERWDQKHLVSVAKIKAFWSSGMKSTWFKNLTEPARSMASETSEAVIQDEAEASECLHEAYLQVIDQAAAAEADEDGEEDNEANEITPAIAVPE